MVAKAAGFKIYSTMGCFAAYNHIRVHPGSRKYTAFSTQNGHHEFLRMPFGLKTAVLVYSKFVAMAMAVIYPANIEIFLDDLLVFTNIMNERFKVL